MAAVLLAAVAASADEAAEIRARTAQRRPVIAALVKQGAVAEGSGGYLEVKDAAAVGDKAAVVKAENADRKKAYGAIAKSLGVSEAEVGRRQAQRLRGK
jgi:uncharacterized protein YdbL (DUF1318 family)